MSVRQSIIHTHTQTFPSKLLSNMPLKASQPLILTLPHSFSLTHSLTNSLTHSLAHLFTHSLTHSLTYSLTHSMTSAKRDHKNRINTKNFTLYINTRHAPCAKNWAEQHCSIKVDHFKEINSYQFISISFLFSSCVGSLYLI